MAMCDMMNGSAIYDFYKSLAKMYTYLHNGDMTKYEKDSKRILTKLNDMLTDNMDDDFCLFGLKMDVDDVWELNTDQCTLQLVNMMEIIQLTHKVFMTLRHSKVKASESTYAINVV